MTRNILCSETLIPSIGKILDGNVVLSPSKSKKTDLMSGENIYKIVKFRDNEDFEVYDLSKIKELNNINLLSYGNLRLLIELSEGINEPSLLKTLNYLDNVRSAHPSFLFLSNCETIDNEKEYVSKYLSESNDLSNLTEAIIGSTELKGSFNLSNLFQNFSIKELNSIYLSKLNDEDFLKIISAIETSFSSDLKENQDVPFDENDLNIFRKIINIYRRNPVVPYRSITNFLYRSIIRKESYIRYYKNNEKYNKLYIDYIKELYSFMLENKDYKNMRLLYHLNKYLDNYIISDITMCVDSDINYFEELVKEDLLPKDLDLHKIYAMRKLFEFYEDIHFFQLIITVNDEYLEDFTYGCVDDAITSCSDTIFYDPEGLKYVKNNQRYDKVLELILKRVEERYLIDKDYVISFLEQFKSELDGNMSDDRYTGYMDFIDLILATSKNRELIKFAFSIKL